MRTGDERRFMGANHAGMAGSVVPNAGIASSVVRSKGNLFSIMGNRIVLHGVSRKEPIHFSALQILHQQFRKVRLPVDHQKIKAVSVGRKRGRSRVSFGGNLVISVLVVDPDRTVLRSDRGYE